MTRAIKEEDLKDFKYKEDEICDNCDNVGSYRTSDFYLCKKCMFDIVRLEVEGDDDNEIH